MKLVRCNGRELTVRDVGPVLITLVRPGFMVEKHLDVIEDDDAARERVRELLASGAVRSS